jgi:hypothetical protein
MKPLLNASRYLVLAAVVGALLGAAALFVSSGPPDPGSACAHEAFRPSCASPDEA